MRTSTSSGGSQIATFLECPRKYYFSEVRRIEPLSIGPKMVRGLVVHEGLCTWYRTHDKIAALGATLSELGSYFAHYPSLEPQKSDISAECCEIVEAYTDNYDELDSLEVLEAERFAKFALGPHSYTVRIDGIGRYLDRLWVIDHKTTNMDFSKFFALHRRDAKTTGYVWVAKQLYPQYEVEGAIINVVSPPKHLKTKDVPVQFARDVSLRNARELESWERSTSDILDVITAFREAGRWNIRNTGQCETIYGQCPFYTLCWLAGEREEEVIGTSYQPRVEAEEGAPEPYYESA